MRRLRGDDGSILPLLAGFVAILVGLVAVVTDASAAFLARRSLAAAADGAALYAAGGVDRDRLYDESLSRLPISERAATERAGTYLKHTSLKKHYRLVAVTDVAVSDSGASVSVSLVATVRLPFTGRVTRGRDTLRVRATSSADSPLR